MHMAMTHGEDAVDGSVARSDHGEGVGVGVRADRDVALRHATSHDHAERMRRHGVALGHAVLVVRRRHGKDEHVLQSQGRHRVVRDGTNAHLGTATRADGSVLHVEIGNLGEELLHLVVIHTSHATTESAISPNAPAFTGTSLEER